MFTRPSGPRPVGMSNSGPGCSRRKRVRATLGRLDIVDRCRMAGRRAPELAVGLGDGLLADVIFVKRAQTRKRGRWCVGVFVVHSSNGPHFASLMHLQHVTRRLGRRPVSEQQPRPEAEKVWRKT